MPPGLARNRPGASGLFQYRMRLVVRDKHLQPDDNPAEGEATKEVARQSLAATATAAIAEPEFPFLGTGFGGQVRGFSGRFKACWGRDRLSAELLNLRAKALLKQRRLASSSTSVEGRASRAAPH